MLAARWMGLAPDGGGRLALSTGSISVLGFEREVRVIWRWNQNR
jgi:probable phosphoglycerate mutase